MQTPTSPNLPSIGMRFGDHLFPAEAFHLDGQRASVSLGANQPMVSAPTRLHLDWEDGRVTELAVAVRELDVPGGIAHLDICGVEGDWRPFMDYLAFQLN
jgi:hypothetical protein